MSDEQLLTQAAKTAGLDLIWVSGPYGDLPSVEGKLWNPLVDDAIAFRLAVHLSLHVKVCRRMVLVEKRELGDDCIERLLPCPLAATRRAITRAAAELGGALPC